MPVITFSSPPSFIAKTKSKLWKQKKALTADGDKQEALIFKLK